jgi:hypothetical protein
MMVEKLVPMLTKMFIDTRKMRIEPYWALTSRSGSKKIIER